MTPEELLKWVQVGNSLLALGVPIAKLVMVFKAMLTEEQAKVVLEAIKAGWTAAAAENHARVAEFEALVGAGG